MRRLIYFFTFLLVSVQCWANNKVVDVEGASLGEIADRSKDGLSSFYKFGSLVCAIVGFWLFASCVIKLIKINKGELPHDRPMGAVMGMVFAAMLAAAGYWLFTLSRTLRGAFVA